MLLAPTAIVAASITLSEPGCVQPSYEHAAEESSLREAPSHMFCSTAGTVQRGDDNVTEGSTKSVKRSLCRYRFPSSFLRQRGSKNVGCEAGPTGCTR